MHPAAEMATPRGARRRTAADADALGGVSLVDPARRGAGLGLAAVVPAAATA